MVSTPACLSSPKILVFWLVFLQGEERQQVRVIGYNNGQVGNKRKLQHEPLKEKKLTCRCD